MNKKSIVLILLGVFMYSNALASEFDQICKGLEMTDDSGHVARFFFEDQQMCLAGEELAIVEDMFRVIAPHFEHNSTGILTVVYDTDTDGDPYAYLILTCKTKKFRDYKLYGGKGYGRSPVERLRNAASDLKRNFRILMLRRGEEA